MSKVFSAEYEYRGSTWSVELKAESFQEAEYRLQALSQGKIVGELMLKIPVNERWFGAIARRVALFFGVER